MYVYGVVPTLNNLRKNPTILDSVTNMLASHEEQVKDALEGKHLHKSGGYNLVDAVNTTPELC